MAVTLYITRTGDMIQTGKPANVTFEEYPEISRTWTRRVVVAQWRPRYEGRKDEKP